MAQHINKTDDFRININWRDQRNILLFWLIVSAVGMGIFSTVEDGDLKLTDFTASLTTEIVGAVLTFLVFDWVVDRRDNERDIARWKRQIRSRANPTAITAAEELRQVRVLTDGSWQYASLSYANLEKADFYRASLQHASLTFANLQGAMLGEADLGGANLQDVNLKGAKLVGTNLAGANLYNVNLQGANLREADLQGAMLAGAKLDEETTLPNNSNYDPQKGMQQLERFTYPNHPTFWRSEMVWSPAYRGDDEPNPDTT